MGFIVLEFILAFAIFACADGTKVVRCKTTFRSMDDPACSMRTENPNNELMCTNIDVDADVGGYFSVDNGVEPLCLTYIFKSTAGLEDQDNLPAGIWLFRSAVFDPNLKTCESVCKMVKDTEKFFPYKTFYIGCLNGTDSNDEDVSNFWHFHSQYDCSSEDMYFNKSKPQPYEVLTTPDPTTITSTTTRPTTFPTTKTTGASSTPQTPSIQTSPTLSPTQSTPTTPTTPTTKPTTPTTPTTPATQTTPTTPTTPTTKPTTPVPLPPEEDPRDANKATLFVGIGEGVVGGVGAAFIVTTNVVLFLQLKKLRAGGSV